MKSLKLLVFTAIVSLVLGLQSCMNDDGPNKSFAISTIKSISKESKDFYFLLDNGSKMYPGDLRSIGSYHAKDGQRTFVVFKELDQKMTGYDYNIEVKDIQDILTKEIVQLTEENVGKIGDDPINLTYAWTAQGYVTIEFQYFGTHTENKKHLLSLVVNQLPNNSTTPEEGYIDLEFRHNKEGDSPDRLGEGYVSFKLDELGEQLKGKKGLKIRVNTIYNGVKYYKINFPTTGGK